MFDSIQLPDNLSGGLDVPLPRMVKVRQSFDRRQLDDIAGSIEAQFEMPEISRRIQPGARIAIGVGSRGISNLEEVVRTVVSGIRKRGGEPFVVPAMGSHGGATPAGQTSLLATFGITEERVGAPVRATMETVAADQMEDGTLLHVDRYAYDADGIVLVNRIKPHTTFRGKYQSGLVKMLVIGLGKIAGATIMHQNHGMDRFDRILPIAADVLLQKLPMLFGVALVEDAYDETALVELVTSEDFIRRETELLTQAESWMGRLYFDDIDVLVIDRIGKEISGSGFDPNIAGRNCRGVEGFEPPRVQRLVVLDLSGQTHGNAIGIGLADITTKGLLEKIDFAATYANTITSAYLDSAAIPIVADTAESAVRLAVKTVLRTKPEQVRLVRILDTLHLGEIEVSESLLPDVETHPKMQAMTPPREIAWDT